MSKVNQSAKDAYLNFLRVLASQWKANTEQYITNKVTLIQDSIVAMASGKEPLMIEFSREKGAFLQLQKLEDGSFDLPTEKRLEYLAMVDFAKELGVELTVEILADNKNGYVFFEVKDAKLPENYNPYRRMVPTNQARLDKEAAMTPSEIELEQFEKNLQAAYRKEQIRKGRTRSF